MDTTNMSSLIEQAGDFELYNFAENHIRAVLKGDDKYVSLGAAETTKQLQIPYAHRLVKILITHTNSVNADSVEPLDVQIRRDKGCINGMPQVKEILQTQSDLVNSHIELTFGDGFEYEATTWTLSFTGTATDRVHLIAYFQRLGTRR